MKSLLTAAIAAMLLSANVAWADLVVTAPDGRPVVLKDDGTWRYQDAPDKGKSDAKEQPMALLRLEKKSDRGISCRIAFSLTNNLPYEIQNVIPYFSAYRTSGVLHESVSVAFQAIRPSDRVEASADFTKIACADIARVQVSGGDRCAMGELHKYSEANGQCLARIRVVPSDLIRFDK